MTRGDPAIMRGCFEKSDTEGGGTAVVAHSPSR